MARFWRAATFENRICAVVGDAAMDVSLVVAAACALLVIVGLIVAHRAFAYRDIPRAPTSAWTNARRLRSTAAPEFLLDTARKLLETGRGGAGCYLLALPTSSIVVVTDATIARIILHQWDGCASPGPRSGYGTCGAVGSSFATQCPVMSRTSRARATRAFTIDQLTRVRECCASRFAEAAPALDAMRAEPADVRPLALRLALLVTTDVALDYMLSGEELAMLINNLDLGQRASLRTREAARARDRLLVLGHKILAHHRANKRAHSADVGSLVAAIESSRTYASDSERCADIVMVLTAAAGGVANAVSWCLFDLASHPAEQQRVREEMRAGTPAPRSCALSNAVHESMRLNPTASAISRTTRVPIPLKGGGHIPSGARVLVPILALHRAAALGSPDDFAPERWTAGLPQLLEHFIPFGVGLRSCVALSFASAQVHELVGLVVGAFRLELVSPPIAVTTNVRRPHGGLLLAQRVGPDASASFRQASKNASAPTAFNLVVHSREVEADDNGSPRGAVTSTRQWRVWGGSPSALLPLTRPHGWRRP